MPLSPSFCDCAAPKISWQSVAVVNLALILFAQALVVLLIGLGLSPLAATLIVAAVFSGVGIAVVAGGRRELDAGTLTPHRTLDDLERDRALVKEKLS